jgi:peroxiredoxin Q/BCP
LRQDYQEFTGQDAEIVVIAPDTMGNARSFFTNNPVPFIALVDDALEVYDLFDVQSKWISLGQRPGLFIIDKQGILRYAYIGAQQWEIPANQEVLAQLKKINEDG